MTTFHHITREIFSKARFTKPLKFLLEALLPSRCLSCGKQVSEQGLVCAECWSDLTFITKPHCPSCSLPYPFEIEKNMLCVYCASKTYAFDRALSVLHYNDMSRKIVLKFKQSDKTFMAPYLANLMYQTGHSLIKEADLLVPIPLHRSKLFSRKFNQAALLSYALSALSGTPTAPDLLLRHKKTQSQGEKSRKDRFANVKNAFSLNEAQFTKSDLKGKNILLIDDVFTTGATLSSCAHVLKKAGAKSVKALTLCRVPKD